jgi:hypothetical protein
MALLVMTRGAFIPKRSVASRTKPRNIASLAAAFWTLHKAILEAKGYGGWMAGYKSSEFVNLSTRTGSFE